MVAKGQQLLLQVLIHELVSKQSASLVGGDQIGRWRLKDKSELRNPKHSAGHLTVETNTNPVRSESSTSNRTNDQNTKSETT